MFANLCAVWYVKKWNTPTIASQIVGAIVMKNIGIKPIHPKEFKKVHNFSTYQMSRLSGYSVEALKNWLADESSSRFVEPKPYVLNHFGAIHNYLLRS